MSVSTLAALIIILVVDDHVHPHECWDCYAPYGFPFLFRSDGGFAGGYHIFWMGLVGDVIFLTLIAGIIYFAWTRISK